MTHRFDPNGRLITVPVYLTGPQQSLDFTFALDTGCTRTTVNGRVLEWLGYTAGQATGRHRVRTGSGTGHAGVLTLVTLSALGRTRSNFPVLWFDLPPASLIDGLLGLDFLRGEVLTLDFARGRIDLGPPRSWWKVWK